MATFIIISLLASALKTSYLVSTNQSDVAYWRVKLAMQVEKRNV